MSRVPRPRSKTRLRTKRTQGEIVFDAKPGSRLLAGALCMILAIMFLVNQTQIGDGHWIFRLISAVATVFFAVVGWYFLRKGARRGPLLIVRPHGFGMALGFSGWIEVPWEDVEAFRYWEPTGIAMLVKRRQSRWVGVLLRRGLSSDSLTWDQRFEIWLNTFHNRPGLCILHPFVKQPILDVLQGFKDFAPKALDDYQWMSR